MTTGQPPFKALKADRFMIRPARVSDAAMMHDAMKTSFPVLKRWMPWAQALASLRDTEIYLAHGERLWSSQLHDGIELPLQIVDLSDTIYYGATGIKPANLLIPSYEIGYWVNQAYTGRGIITDAMNVLTKFLFKELNAKRVEINCESGNAKSSQVPKRLNYDLEGTLRNQRLMADGKTPTDSMIFACVDVSKLPPIDYRLE